MMTGVETCEKPRPLTNIDIEICCGMVEQHFAANNPFGSTRRQIFARSTTGEKPESFDETVPKAWFWMMGLNTPLRASRAFLYSDHPVRPDLASMVPKVREIATELIEKYIRQASSFVAHVSRLEGHVGPDVASAMEALDLLDGERVFGILRPDLFRDLSQQSGVTTFDQPWHKDFGIGKTIGWDGGLFKEYDFRNPSVIGWADWTPHDESRIDGCEGLLWTKRAWVERVVIDETLSISDHHDKQAWIMNGRKQFGWWISDPPNMAIVERK